MSREKTHVKVLSGAMMLHPESCGSSIRWAISAYKRHGERCFDATVSLTDCDRGIKWGGWGSNGAREMDDKLTAAINALVLARAAVREIGEHYEQIPKRGKK